MLPDRVSKPGPLTYESGALPIALRGPCLEGSEESKGGLDWCSVRGDLNVPEQKQQQKSISTDKGSNLKETG